MLGPGSQIEAQLAFMVLLSKNMLEGAEQIWLLLPMAKGPTVAPFFPHQEEIQLLARQLARELPLP